MKSMDTRTPMPIYNKDVISHTTVISANYELIDSNSFLFFDGSASVDILETFANGFEITIRITCVSDDSNNQRLDYVANAENNTIEYKCLNFNNSLGTGTSKPVEIGAFNGKKLYIHFWIYAMGNDRDTRRLEYSIWKER